MTEVSQPPRGVVALIHRDYVRTGRLSMDMGRILSMLSDLRSVGDYGGAAHVSYAEANMALIEAQQFPQEGLEGKPYIAGRKSVLRGYLGKTPWATTSTPVRAVVDGVHHKQGARVSSQ